MSMNLFIEIVIRFLMLRRTDHFYHRSMENWKHVTFIMYPWVLGFSWNYEKLIDSQFPGVAEDRQCSNIRSSISDEYNRNLILAFNDALFAEQSLISCVCVSHNLIDLLCRLQITLTCVILDRIKHIDCRFVFTSLASAVSPPTFLRCSYADNHGMHSLDPVYASIISGAYCSVGSIQRGLSRIAPLQIWAVFVELKRMLGRKLTCSLL